MTATHNADLSFYRKSFFVIIGCFFSFFNSINEWVGIIAIEAPYARFRSPLKTNTLINENRRNWEMRAKRIRISYIGVNDLWTYTYLVWYWVNLIFCMDIQMQCHYLYSAFLLSFLNANTIFHFLTWDKLYWRVVKMCCESSLDYLLVLLSMFL